MNTDAFLGQREPEVTAPSAETWAQPDYSHMALTPSCLELHSRNCVQLGPSEYDMDEGLRLTLRGMKAIGAVAVFGSVAGILGEAINPANEGRVGLAGVIAFGLSTVYTVGAHALERRTKRQKVIAVTDKR